MVSTTFFQLIVAACSTAAVLASSANFNPTEDPNSIQSVSTSSTRALKTRAPVSRSLDTKHIFRLQDDKQERNQRMRFSAQYNSQSSDKHNVDVIASDASSSSLVHMEKRMLPAPGSHHTPLVYPTDKTDPHQKYSTTAEAWLKDPFHYYDMFHSNSLIGEGGFGKVYKGRLNPKFKHQKDLPKSLDPSQLVAIKVIDLRPGRDGSIEEAVEEVRFMQILSAPHLPLKNVVGFYDSFYKNSHYYIVMEYMELGSLSNLAAQEDYGILDEQIIAWICHEVLQGLQYMHSSAHVLHRDIKPDNILIGSHGEIKLADFGLSAKLEKLPHYGLVTTSLSQVGTNLYMSPEARFNSAKGIPYGPEIDVWSLGITAMELKAGRTPFLYEFIMTKINKLGVGSHNTPVLKRGSFEFNDFLAATLNINSAKRFTVPALLEHPFILKNMEPGKSKWLSFIQKHKGPDVQVAGAKSSSSSRQVKRVDSAKVV